MGVRGYVLKRSPAELLMQALRAVSGGGTFIDPQITGCVVGDFVGARAESPTSFAFIAPAGNGFSSAFSLVTGVSGSSHSA